MTRAALSAGIVCGLMMSPVIGAEGEAPGDDVMRVPQYGLRLTPRIAGGFSRLAIKQGLGEKLDLSDQQVEELSDATARRIMQLGHEDGFDVQSMLEYLIPAMTVNNGRLDGESGQELARRMLPVLGSYRKLLKGFTRDARPVLSAEQNRQLDEVLEEARGELKPFEKRMKKWAAGEVEEGTNPFDDPPREPRKNDGKKEDPKRQALRQAENMTRWQIRRLGPPEWRRLLFATQHYFKFDDEQRAEGGGILDHYTAEAEAVMNDKWKEGLRRNRIQYNLRWSLRDEFPTGPWVYHLDRAYEEAIEPVEELGKAFRKEIYGLATAEQRQAFDETIRQVGGDHGMTEQEIDLVSRVLLALGSD